MGWSGRVLFLIRKYGIFYDGILEFVEFVELYEGM